MPEIETPTDLSNGYSNGINGTKTTPQRPYLRETPNSKQLIVDGEPFLMLAGELQNSSLTSAEYMRTVWQKMVDTNINTLLGCVMWEWSSPWRESLTLQNSIKSFWTPELITCGWCFSGLGRSRTLTGVYIRISTYAPAWVKTNTKRFPRAKLRKAGGILETADVVSIFHDEAPKADAKAFSTLMRHIKEIDDGHSTVIMVQVENETGLLGDSRDGSSAAEKRFHESVPAELVEYIATNRKTLLPDFQKSLSAFQTGKGRSTWEDVFGKSAQTNELFMAYNYARYLDQVAAAGRREYDVQLYTNDWQNYFGSDNDPTAPVIVGGGGDLGDYPSGGGTSSVLDIWTHFAPSLDFVAPDVYLNDYASSCSNNRHLNQPLFIPEQRRDEYGARRIWTAFGSYQCLGTSPFGIDTLEPESNPFTRHYGLLSRVQQIVLEAQRRPGSSMGFFFDEVSGDSYQDSKAHIARFGNFEVRIERAFVFGKPGPGAGMIIHLEGAKFLLIGWGFQAVFKSVSLKSAFTGILSMVEKEVTDVKTGKLKTLRTLNGDETRSGKFCIMPNEDPDYGGFPICVTIPARTMISEVEVYSLEDDEDS